MKKLYLLIILCLCILSPFVFAQLPKPSDPEFIYNITEKGIILDQNNYFKIGDDSTQVVQKMQSAGWKKANSPVHGWEFKDPGLFLVQLRFSSGKLRRIGFLSFRLFYMEKNVHENIINNFKKRFFVNTQIVDNTHICFQSQNVSLYSWWYENIDFRWQISVY